MYIGTYSKFRCEKCRATNWIDYEQGNHGYSCWKCQAIEYFDEYDDEKELATVTEGWQTISGME